MLKLYRGSGKTILYLIGIVSIISIVAFSALYFISSTFNQHNLVKQLTVKLGLHSSNKLKENLLSRRMTRYQHLAVNHPFPRVLNNEYMSYNNPHVYYKELEAFLNNGKSNSSLECNKADLRTRLSCFLYFGDTDKSQLNKLVNAFINFDFDQDTLGDDALATNWQYAYLYDIARAVANFNTSDIEQIDAKIAQHLQKQLTVLEQNTAPLWGSKSSIAAKAFLLASVLELNNTKNKALFSRAYWQFLDVLNALETSPIWPQGYFSWLNQYGIESSLAMSALMNHPESELRQRTYNILNEIGLAHIHLTRPDGFIPQVQDQASTTGITLKNIQVIDILAKATNADAILKYSVWLKAKYGEQVKRDKTNVRYSFDSFFVSQQLFSEPYIGVKTTDLSFLDASLVPGKVFGNNSIHDAFFRTNWSTNASYIHVMGNPLFTPQQQHSAGHFTLFKQAPLITTFALNASKNSINNTSFTKRTLSKNSILIKPNLTPESLHEHQIVDGGQRIIAEAGNAISRFKDWYRDIKNQGKYYTGFLIEANVDSAPQIINIDISPAYNNNHKASRRFIYLPNEDAFIINDLVKTQNNDFEIKSIFHMLTRPIIDGPQRIISGTLLDGISQSIRQEFRVQVDDANLYADVALPLNAKLTVVGGERYQYYVNDESPLDEKDVSLQAQGLRSKPSSMWRLELSEEFSSGNYRSLLVLQARLNKTSKSKVNYYIKEDLLSIFTVGETLILYGDIPAQHDFYAMNKISQILILSSSAKLKYTVSSVDDCNSFTQTQSSTFFALFNVQILGKVSVQVSDINKADNRCWN